MSYPTIEHFTIGLCKICLRRSPSISEKTLGAFLAALGIYLQNLEEEFILSIVPGRFPTCPSIHIDTKIEQADRSHIEASIRSLASPLPGQIALVVSNWEGWSSLKEMVPDIHKQSADGPYPDLPEGLNRITNGDNGTPSASQERRDLEEKIALLIKRHFEQNKRNTIAICLEGPPGSGKTTLAKKASQLSGYEVFILSGFHSKYVNESAERLKNIFQFLQDRKAVVIYDEIDTLVGRRGVDGEVASKDHNMTVGILYAAMDKTQLVLLGTTNLRNALDDGFLSRVGANLYNMPSANYDERRSYLKSHIQPPLDDLELKELVLGSIGCSFRDLQALCDCLGEKQRLTVLRSEEAWSKAFRGRKGKGIDGNNNHETWSKALPSSIDGQKKIWHLTSLFSSSRVLVSSKGNMCYLGKVSPTGHLELEESFAATNDVNAACLSADRTLVVTSTDDGIFAHKLNEPKSFKSFSLEGHVWDTVPIGATGYLASIAESGSSIEIWSVKSNGEFARRGNLRGLKELRSISYLEMGDYHHFLFAGGKSSLCIFEINFASQSEETLIRRSEIPLIHAYTDRRTPIIQSASNEFHVAVPMEGQVAIWRIDGKWVPERIHQFFIGDSSIIPVCAFDRATGRLAVALEKEIWIYDEYLSTDGAPSQKISHSAKGTITALCFAQYGRVIIWGTDKGKVCTSFRNGF